MFKYGAEALITILSMEMGRYLTAPLIRIEALDKSFMVFKLYKLNNQIILQRTKLLRCQGVDYANKIFPLHRKTSKTSINSSLKLANESFKQQVSITLFELDIS